MWEESKSEQARVLYVDIGFLTSTASQSFVWGFLLALMVSLEAVVDL